jgi:hypothetical protein
MVFAWPCVKEWFSAFILSASSENLNESRIITDIGFDAMGEEGKFQTIDRKVTFDAIGGFVRAKSFALHGGIAGVF